MQWVMASAAAAALPFPMIAQGEQAAAAPAAAGYGTDPKLLPPYKPGDFWPLTLTAEQKKTAAALADVILPDDAYGPAASKVGVVDMLDEWMSAPYPTQQHDRQTFLQGFSWLEAEANKRFGHPFHELAIEQQHAICDDICFAVAAKAEFRKPAQFFSRFRTVCASAYYATPEGWKAIGYIGNVALPSFDGPPPEVLEKLGITQTVGEMHDKGDRVTR